MPISGALLQLQESLNIDCDELTLLVCELWWGWGVCVSCGGGGGCVCVCEGPGLLWCVVYELSSTRTHSRTYHPLSGTIVFIPVQGEDYRDIYIYMVSM